MIHRIFLLLLAGEFLAGLLALLVQLFVVVPYGRHGRESSGTGVSPRIAFFAVALASMAAMIATYTGGGRSVADPALFFLLLWLAAFFYRGVIYPWAVRSGGRPFPALVAVGAVLFAAMGGFINGYYLFMLPFSYEAQSLFATRALVGVALFVLGVAAHCWSDSILSRLRRKGDKGYSIPRGGLFQFVSSPNYLGAIIQWCGWAVMVWNLPGFAVAWLTFGTLFPRALANHRWYRRRFPDYPWKRRALIPFVL